MDDQIPLPNMHSEVYLIEAPLIFGKLRVRRPTKPPNALSSPEPNDIFNCFKIRIIRGFVTFSILPVILNLHSSVLNISKTVTWIDSSVAYSWITNSSKIYKTFIQNIVNEIRKNIKGTAHQFGKS